MSIIFLATFKVNKQHEKQLLLTGVLKNCVKAVQKPVQKTSKKSSLSKLRNSLLAPPIHELNTCWTPLCGRGYGKSKRLRTWERKLHYGNIYTEGERLNCQKEWPVSY